MGRYGEKHSNQLQGLKRGDASKPNCIFNDARQGLNSELPNALVSLPEDGKLLFVALALEALSVKYCRGLSYIFDGFLQGATDILT